MAIKKKPAPKKTIRKKAGGNVTKSGAHNNPTKTSTRAVTVTMSGIPTEEKRFRKSLAKKGLRATHGYDLKKRSITGIKAEGKKIISHLIGVEESKKFTAKGKREKNKIAKVIADLKKDYRKFS